MVEKLRPGSLQARVTKGLRVSDFVLTEAAYDARSRLPPHTHERSYFCFVLQGAYTERYRRQEILCKPSSVTFRSSELRIEHACEELVKRDLPLATIALQAGFVDQSYFSKVFKSFVGTTPAKYRRSFRRS